MEMKVDLRERSYPIYIERGLLGHINDVMDPDRHYALIHDDGIPGKWVELVKSQLPNAEVISFPQGEASKSFSVFEKLTRDLADRHFGRKDAVIALGGGVTGDLAGFVSACYMRGIDYIQIPTTVLSQVDSSVGGKTAIDVGTMKNLCGAFWQPRAVLIDPDVLSTLDERQIAAGLVEALKMGLILDADLFEEFEKDEPDTDAIIARSIELKKEVVEQDEKESSLRKILNFGHTIGHAIEAAYEGHDFLHGECVGFGMDWFIEDEDLRNRVKAIRRKLNLPEAPDYDPELVYEILLHDKKGSRESVDTIWVSEPGKAEIRTLSYTELKKMLEEKPL